MHTKQNVSKTINPIEQKKCIPYRIEQAQLQRKDHPMRHLNMPIILLHILEALQVQCQYHWQLLHAHPLLGLLVAAAVVALELVVAAQRLRVAEAAQAMRDAGVLIDIHLQIEEVLILAAHRLAVQAARLAGENTLEDLVHPRRLRGGAAGRTARQWRRRCARRC